MRRTKAVSSRVGGNVVLVRPRPAVFALFLPHGTADPPERPAVIGPA